MHAMPDDQQTKLEPIAVSPKQALQLLPIGNTKLWEAIRTGEIKSRFVNNRRWLDYQSVKKFGGFE
jgi:hypothetical protein